MDGIYPFNKFKFILNHKMATNKDQRIFKENLNEKEEQLNLSNLCDREIIIKGVLER